MKNMEWTAESKSPWCLSPAFGFVASVKTKNTTSPFIEFGQRLLLRCGKQNSIIHLKASPELCWFKKNKKNRGSCGISSISRSLYFDINFRDLRLKINISSAVILRAAIALFYRLCYSLRLSHCFNEKCFT